MRIVEVIDTLEIGGLERMAVDLSIELRRRGHEVSLLCLRNSGPLEQVLNEASVHTLAFQKPEGVHLRTLSRFVRYLKRVGAEVVHTHNVAVHHYGAAAARLAGVPAVVSTRHGLGHYGTPRSERLFEVACHLTDCVVAVSRAAHDYFVASSRVPTRKWTYIYNGIPVERFHSAPLSGKSEIVFGTVGRLDPIKDHLGMLDAFAQVHAEYPQVRFRILGDGPSRAMLEEVARKLDLGAAVRFEGASLDVPGFLAELDVFVMGSKSEGLPLAMLEAMAAGLPVVSTSVGGIPELIEDGVSGWLCPPTQPDSLAAIMKRTITADRRRMGEVGRTRVLASHSITEMAVGYEALFADIMARRGFVSRSEVAHV